MGLKLALLLILLLEIDGHRIELNDRDWTNNEGLNFYNNPQNLQKGGNLNGFEKASRYLLDSVDLNVDPCDNFYQYSCGNWMKSNSIGSDESSISRYSILQKKIVNEINDALTQKSTDNEIDAIKNAKFAYNSCMDQESLNRAGTTKLREEIKRLGGWPLIDQKAQNSNSFNLTEFLIGIRRERSKDALFYLMTTPNTDNSSQYLLYLVFEGPQFGNVEYYFEEKYSNMLDAYQTYMLKTVLLIANDSKLDVDVEDVFRQVNELVVFGKELAKIKNSTVFIEDFKASLLKTRPSELSKVFPLIDWNHYLHQTLPVELHEYLQSDPQMYIESSDEFKNLTNLLQRTDQRILANYLMMSYVFSRSYTLDGRFEELEQEFSRKISGVENIMPRNLMCTYYISSLFPMAVDLLYIRKNFDKNTQKQVEELLMELRSVFGEVIKNNTWMKESDKKYATKKLEKMGFFVGSSPQMNDSRVVDEEYKNIKLNFTENFDELIGKIKPIARNQALQRLLTGQDLERSAMHAFEVNAQYSISTNILSIPVSILQYPFIDPEFPKVMLYASLGTILGHELSHGFDGTGSQFDEIGNMKKWWNAETEKQFKNRTKCFVEQFSKANDTELGVKVNGNLTLDENVADSGGIKISYLAFKRYADKQQSLIKIPGMEKFSADQLFFLSFGALECTNELKQSVIDDFLNDNHLAQPFRVNLMFANQPDFVKAFNCPVGSKMNPDVKCTIW